MAYIYFSVLYILAHIPNSYISQFKTRYTMQLTFLIVFVLAAIETIVGQTSCGNYAGSTTGSCPSNPSGFGKYKLMQCSTSSSTYILQPPTTSTYWWTVSNFINSYGTSSSTSSCYAPTYFNIVQTSSVSSACPACSGTWKQVSLSGGAAVSC